MSVSPEINFSRSTRQAGGLAIILRDEAGRSSAALEIVDPEGVIARAARLTEFKGNAKSDIEIVAPAGSPADRIVVLGIGKPSERDQQFWIKLGGRIAAAAKTSKRITVWLDLADSRAKPEDVASVALGILLRSYRFDRYKTRQDEDNGKEKPADRFTLVASTATTSRREFEDAQAIAGGVHLARDLVNEPGNVLGPVEFAHKARELASLGVRVEILTDRDMQRLGMGALLGVSQGSARPPRLVVMQWNGGRTKDKPIAFVGKGVVFDTGGISIKPAGGMEDMKGDMAGAAAVVGLMHALAARKAKANVVGVIGLVENMPDGNAQRPGDVVTSLSGQTIEVINTDAEGRLVLADALWYCNDRFQPRFMVNLATLTGAILVALGKQHAGLFSNDDTLATQLVSAGNITGERVWRMPLGPEYDKMIDSRIADMKNVGGRFGGSITAAQFLQRFVRETPWAHLDIAGTAMDSEKNEYSQSWASGFGVRLLDRLVRDHYER